VETALTTAAIPPAYLSSPRFHLDGGLMMITLSPLNMIKFELPMEIEVKDGAGGLCLISTYKSQQFSSKSSSPTPTILTRFILTIASV